MLLWSSLDHWAVAKLSERLETDVGTTEQDPTPHRASDKGFFLITRHYGGYGTRNC